uniref:pancreatic triacylglycerol lipase-like isoform X1 n=1 Tax=Ciona intestinalis TaxID=7719 RepID=UPI000EF553A6|nr:pancreatic triacylglycerol lipase-like isoform X1 [Ciona intestinalis]|eukprot:XP_026690490.1 pancreatic triacylglycerol lipase-like isoform X1 [Ciona intestinalis]
MLFIKEPSEVPISLWDTAGEVCFDELGCFGDSRPFTSLQRPIPYLPWSPVELNTEFWLYTRLNRRTYNVLKYNDQTSINNSHFRAIRPTKFLVHGFVSSGETSWVQDMKNVLLDAEDVNVIVVNWEQGANPKLNYGQATANTRVVGAEIALLINRLEEQSGALEKNAHIIGHGLGAHVAGYAGERLKRLGRITGLDPAEPFYQGTDPVVRLDPTDALYVDAIHTDGKPYWQFGWGMMDPVGHADFYPNGGQDQPGCPGNEEESGNWWEVTCNHGRSCELMIDSIVNAKTPMIGHPCADYDSYLTGKCDNCAEAGCATLGYYSDANAQKAVSVKYYLQTRSEVPFT